MNFVLLLGAGFSRNWGGWLAAEAFEYLLSCPEMDESLRQLLLKHRDRGGFEAAFGEVQETFIRGGRRLPDQRLDRFQSAIRRMFNEMDRAFDGITFEPQNDIKYQVATFLVRFDAIFTLNQDLLLERHYLNDNVSLLSNGKWSGFTLPGMLPGSALHNPNLGMLLPGGSDTLKIEDRFQPYIKLHGSSNWYDSTTAEVMVLGANKSALINEQPVLKWNLDQFVRHLGKRQTRLMVIGYSFSDNHINNAILAAAQAKNIEVVALHVNLDKTPEPRRETFTA